MNVPLKDGIDDDSYAALFKPVMRKLIEVYQPTAVVFQSGKASLRSLCCVIWSLWNPVTCKAGESGKASPWLLSYVVWSLWNPVMCKAGAIYQLQKGKAVTTFACSVNTCLVMHKITLLH